MRFPPVEFVREREREGRRGEVNKREGDVKKRVIEKIAISRSQYFRSF
jgi:hypothetical protein